MSDLGMEASAEIVQNAVRMFLGFSPNDNHTTFDPKFFELEKELHFIRMNESIGL